MNETELEQELKNMQERNRRVELDKAWETSLVRRLYIMGITYATAVVWLLAIKEPNAWLKAFIPALAYALSTLSLPPLRRWWLKNR